MHLSAQQRLSLNCVIPHKRILVVCRQINRKHDIPVCSAQESVDLLCPACVRVSSDTSGLPRNCVSFARLPHRLSPFSILAGRMKRRPFSSEPVSVPSCPAGDNHLATSVVFRISFLVTPKKDITNNHISISDLSRPRPAPRVRRSDAA